MNRFPTVTLSLPAWIEDAVPAGGLHLDSVESRMAFVVQLSRRNVEEATGGPFAAAVFEVESGRLVAPGVNRVIPASCSAAHAEMVALMIAQQVIGSFDLGGEGQPAYELVSSTEPCAMCLGAIPWSGVRRLVCGARKEDAEAFGFDEGARPDHWIAELASRRIEAIRDIYRQEATEVLRHYVDLGGVPYNGRRGEFIP